MKKKNNNLSQNEADTFLTYAKKCWISLWS